MKQKPVSNNVSCVPAHVLWGFFSTLATEHGLVVCAQEAPPSHDILVFMTGQEEIEALARTCRDIAKHLPDSCGPMVVIPLYASLPPVQQLRVFQPAPKVKAVNMQEQQSSKGHVCATLPSAVHCCSQLCFCCKHICLCFSFTATLKA